jgi:DNA-binding MarR family transcriptional regulator
MADRKRVNLTVSPAQKEKWDTAVSESPEYSSLSGLIRTAVAHELSEGSGEDTGEVSSRTAGANTEALEKVTDTLTRMESTLNSLEERVGNLEQEVNATEKTNLKNEIFKVLPHSGSISSVEVAKRINRDEKEVINTLSRLAEQTGMVERAGSPVDDGPAYYRRVD